MEKIKLSTDIEKWCIDNGLKEDAAKHLDKRIYQTTVCVGVGFWLLGLYMGYYSR